MAAGDLNFHMSQGDRWVFSKDSARGGKWTDSTCSDADLFREVFLRPFLLQPALQDEPSLRARNNKFIGINDRFFFWAPAGVCLAAHITI